MDDIVNGKPKPLESDTVKHLKKELYQVRNTVNKLLEKLDSLDTAGPVASGSKKEEKESEKESENDTKGSNLIFIFILPYNMVYYDASFFSAL